MKSTRKQNKSKKKKKVQMKYAERVTLNSHWKAIEDSLRDDQKMIRSSYFIHPRHKLYMKRLKKKIGKGEAEIVREGVELVIQKYRKIGVFR